MEIFVSTKQYSEELLTRPGVVAPSPTLLSYMDAMLSQANAIQEFLALNAAHIVREPVNNLLKFRQHIDPIELSYRRDLQKGEKQKSIVRMGGFVNDDHEAEFRYTVGTVAYEDGATEAWAVFIKNEGPYKQPKFRFVTVYDHHQEYGNAGRAAGGARKRASLPPLPDYTFHPQSPANPQPPAKSPKQNNFEIVYEKRVGDVWLVCAQADITKVWATAIVNAANEQLSHGAGVARAISDAAGPGDNIVKMQSRRWLNDNPGGLRTGKAVAVTESGLMSRNGIQYVIHVTGPREVPGWQKLLYDAVMLALKTAEDLHCTSVALPAISSGIFGCPLDECARVITQCGVDFALTKPVAVNRISFVNIDKGTTLAMAKALEKLIKELNLE